MEIRCDKSGIWHSSHYLKWASSSVSITHIDKLPHKLEVCGQCKTLKGKSMDVESTIHVNHHAVLQRVSFVLDRVGFRRHG